MPGCNIPGWVYRDNSLESLERPVESSSQHLVPGVFQPFFDFSGSKGTNGNV